MKRFAVIFSVSLVLLSGSACTVYDNADEVSSPDSNVNEIVFSRVLRPFFRIVELSDFYYRYMILKGSEDSVESLVTEYFGETVEMEDYGEKGVAVDHWGSIDVSGTDLEYEAVLSSIWTGLCPAYSVTATDHRTYHVVYDEENNREFSQESGYEVELEADVTVTGSDVEVDALNVVYTDISLSEPLVVKVSAGSDGETVRIGLCRGGTFANYPGEGTLYFSVSGYMTDNFKVEFSEDDLPEVVAGGTVDVGLDGLL